MLKETTSKLVLRTTQVLGVIAAIMVIWAGIAFSVGYFQAKNKPVPQQTYHVKETVPTDENTPDNLLTHINEYRASKGLPAEKLADELNTAAQQKCQYMYDHNFYDHTDGVLPFQYFIDQNVPGTIYNYGENLVLGSPDAQETVNRWINSPEHEAILTGDYNYAGFATCRAANQPAGAVSPDAVVSQFIKY